MTPVIRTPFYLAFALALLLPACASLTSNFKVNYSYDPEADFPPVAIDAVPPAPKR